MNNDAPNQGFPRNPFDDTSGSFIRTDPRTRSERTLQPFDLAPPGWSSYRRKIRRGESEVVQVTIWQRGDEQIITLQWLDRDQTGMWRPRNVPPVPSALL